MRQTKRVRRTKKRIQKGGTKRRTRANRNQCGGAPVSGMTYLSRDEFNAKFKTDIVTLPTYLYAIGLQGGAYYFYSENEKLIGGHRNSESDFLERLLKDINKDSIYFIVNTSDAYSERMPVPEEPVEYYLAGKDQFKGKAEISEPDPHKYPLLHSKKYVLCFSKRKFDPYSIVIPNPYHLNGTIDARLKEVEENRIPWEQKKPLAVWRGTLTNGGENGLRTKFVELVNSGKLPLVDYSASPMSVGEMAKYKYQIDLDGWANAWDGLVWKLASGSVVLKHESVWEQMYYKWLKPGVHYVPVKADLSDLAEKIQWCVDHDAECKKIGEAGQKFVKEHLGLENLRKETLAAVAVAI
jgi:hypothetical protein